MYAKRVYAINEAHTTDSNQYTPSISEITRTTHYAYYTSRSLFCNPGPYSAPQKYSRTHELACPAYLLFLMVLKMHLAKVIVTVVAMPTGNSVTDYTLAYRFVVVVVFSLFCRRCFLLLWLCLHMSYASEG